VAKANLASNAQVLVKYLDELSSPFIAVMESTRALYWAYDALTEAGMIEHVYVAEKPMRRLKEMLRHRMRLVRDSTRLKNRIRNILVKMNLSAPR
jgi:transposase